ncbi:MAG: IS110 family transposase [Chloroflexota bacterium]|nr:IS110 family transposase [Chloroflexota bacterium]
MYTRIIGIDLGVTAQHQAVVLDPATGQFIGRSWRFSSTPAALQRLIQRARQGLTGEVRLIAILEATGMAWYPVGGYLHDQGVTVYRVNGRQTKDLRQVYHRHASSDRIDCRVLTHLYQVAAERLTPWQPPSGQQLALQRACREFDRWRQLDVAIQNRLTSYDQWAWRSLTPLIPAEAQDWMRRYWYDPWQVAATALTTLTAAWQAAAPKQPADLAWIPAWIKRAQELTRLYGSPERVGYADLQLTLQRNLTLQQQSRLAQEELKQQLILPLYRQLYPDCYLETIYGIGALSAAIYLAFIQDIARFRTCAQLRSWCGLIPGSQQSGQAEAKGLRITQTGPNLIKATLYQNAEVARQWDVQFAALYYRQMVDYGKHHTQAVCACASHLSSRIYTILKEQRPYELRDLQGQPISVQQSRQLCLTQFHVPEKVRRRKRVRDRRARANQRSERRFRQ